MATEGTRIQHLFGSRDGAFYQGKNSIASEVPRAYATRTNLFAAWLAHYQIAPDAASATYVLAATALTAAAQVITAGITNPDFPRVVTIQGNAAGMTGNVVVAGTNYKGVAITDTIALNGATEVSGAKAFRTVTSITLPAETHVGTDTVSLGVANIIGLPHIVEYAGCLLQYLFDGSVDTGGTLAVSATAIDGNLYTMAGTANGTKLLDLFYMV
jgi:hypothetical protein